MLGVNNLYAQKPDTLNVYFQALKLHLDYWDNFHTQRPDLVDIPSIYYIEQNNYTTDSLPDSINGHKILILSVQDIYDKTRKQIIPLIAIHPARWVYDRLEIHVIDFGVSRKRKNFFYSNRGGSSFEIISDGDNRIGIKIINQGGI